MEKVTIVMETTNDAFDKEGVTEIARILRNVAYGINNGEITAPGKVILDINGNKIGKVEIE